MLAWNDSGQRIQIGPILWQQVIAGKRQNRKQSIRFREKLVSVVNKKVSKL